jgi:YD repeat-containing protein
MQEVTTHFTYTSDYNAVKTITDPLGHITFDYDNKGNLTSSTDPGTPRLRYGRLGRTTLSLTASAMRRRSNMPGRIF